MTKARSCRILRASLAYCCSHQCRTIIVTFAVGTWTRMSLHILKALGISHPLLWANLVLLVYWLWLTAYRHFPVLALCHSTPIRTTKHAKTAFWSWPQALGEGLGLLITEHSQIIDWAEKMERSEGLVEPMGRIRTTRS